jgi:predicted TIM-barrel fold metal-dependent hydrolase
VTRNVISADSHITEPPNTYVDHIDAKWRDKAPRIVRHQQLGDVFVIDGMKRPVPLGLVAAAGKPPEEIRATGVLFEELHRGGWDPEARMADQDRDGVAGEIIYPTVGMMLCNHRNFDYKKACFDAYNRWVAGYCGAHPDRLFGCGQTAMRTPEEGIEDLKSIRALGLSGVMMPGDPAVEDYDSSLYDDFYRAAIELELPLSFHILIPVDHPRLPGHHGHVHPRRGLRAPSRAQGRLRGGGCRLGAALHVPHGPRLQAALQLAARRAEAVEAPVRVLPREHLHDLPGRLGRVQDRRSDEPRAPDVGERLPAQRLHVALVPGDAGSTRQRSEARAAGSHPA